MSNPTPQSAPTRALRWGVAGSVVVMIAAGGLFYYASQLAAGKRQANHNEIAVTIHSHACEPNALTVPAGHASFRIINRSDRAVEWEILDGVLVVEERENIAPGLSQVINANLLPGDYAITCGLLSNPRGTLHVTPTAESDAQAKAAVDGGLYRPVVGVSRVPERPRRCAGQGRDGPATGHRRR